MPHRYTEVTERRGERFDATYRRVIDVTIAKTAYDDCDYYCTAYVGGYMLTDHSYLGYTWGEVKRMFKQEIEEEIEKVITEGR